MRTLKCAGLPGLEPETKVYEFHVFENDLRLEIPADHRGPDVAIADHPAQEAWLNRWPGGLKQTWDCQWTFDNRAALERFLTELGAPLREAPVAMAAPAPQLLATPPAPPAAAASAPVAGDELVLEGGPPGNHVEVARAGDVIVSVGLCRGVPRPWDVVAQKVQDPKAFPALVAHWSKDFPVVKNASTTRARALADELARQAQLWVGYRHRSIDGAATFRVLDLGDRVAFEKLGKKPALKVFATLDQALDKGGPRDVASMLEVPTAAEREAIAALGAPKAPRVKKAKPLGPDATLKERLAEAFRRLDALRVLALARVAGPQSHAWGTIEEARQRAHAGAVFFLREHLAQTVDGRPLLLYWVSWESGAVPLEFAHQVVAVLEGVGLAATAPKKEQQSIEVGLRG